MAVMSLPPRLVLPALLLFGACGGGDDPPVTADRVEGTPDAGAGGPDAGDAPPTCAVPDGLGDVMAMAAAAQFPQEDTMPMGPKLIQIEGQLNDDPAPDVLIIQLWDNYGPFVGGPVAPIDSYAITGMDTDWTRCGACVAIAADMSPMGQPAQLYVAESGTITITNVTGNVTGNISSVSLRHVDILPGPTQMDNPSGCDTTITSWSFDATIQMP